MNVNLEVWTGRSTIVAVIVVGHNNDCVCNCNDNCNGGSLWWQADNKSVLSMMMVMTVSDDNDGKYGGYSGSRNNDSMLWTR